MTHLATKIFVRTWQISTILFVEYGIYRKREKEALRVELCKILIPRDSHELLYLVSDFGCRHGWIGGFPR